MQITKEKRLDFPDYTRLVSSLIDRAFYNSDGVSFLCVQPATPTVAGSSKQVAAVNPEDIVSALKSAFNVVRQNQRLNEAFSAPTMPTASYYTEKEPTAGEVATLSQPQYYEKETFGMFSQFAGISTDAIEKEKAALQLELENIEGQIAVVNNKTAPIQQQMQGLFVSMKETRQLLQNNSLTTDAINGIKEKYEAIRSEFEAINSESIQLANESRSLSEQRKNIQQKLGDIAAKEADVQGEPVSAAAEPAQTANAANVRYELPAKQENARIPKSVDASMVFDLYPTSLYTAGGSYADMGAGDFARLQELVDSLDPADFEDACHEVPIEITYVENGEGQFVVHEARNLAGELLPKVCGVCRQEMFKYAGEMDEIVIGLLGSERVAKTSAIASTLYGFMLDEKGIQSSVYFDVPRDDDRWVKNVEEPLLANYRNGYAVEKTPTEKAGFYFCVTVKATLPEYSKKRKSCILTFIDMPGEYMNDPKGLASQWHADYKELFRNVDAFWFCMDLAQLYQIANGDYLKATGYGAIDTSLEHNYLAHIVKPSYLQNNLREIKLALSKNVFPPTAIILTKSDTAVSSGIWTEDSLPSFIFEKGEPFAGEDKVYSIDDNCLLLDAFADQSLQIRNALNSKGRNTSSSVALIPMLEEIYTDRAYFSTSAYSRSAQRKPEGTANPGQLPPGPVPFRARLPLYWTLAALGFLGIRANTAGEDEGGFLKSIFSSIGKNGQGQAVDDIIFLDTSGNMPGKNYQIFKKLCMGDS